MVSNFIEHVQGLVSQLRDLENAHHEKLLEIAIITLEKVVKNELDDEIPDDLREVCILPVHYDGVPMPNCKLHMNSFSANHNNSRGHLNHYNDSRFKFLVKRHFQQVPACLI